MEIGQKIDNKYMVIGILEQTDSSCLLSVLKGLESFHMLVFFNVPESIVYAEFDLLSFDGSIDFKKTDTLAYILFPYNTCPDLSGYMLCIHHSDADEMLTNASCDRLLSEIQFYEAMIRSLPEGEKKNVYKQHLQLAKRELEKQQAKEQAKPKKKAPSFFERFRQKIRDLRSDITIAVEERVNRAPSPPIAARFDGHYMLSRKNIGSCKELKGDIKLFVIMVNDPDSIWSEKDKAHFLDVCKQACMFLMDQANLRYHTSLKLSTVYDTFTLDYVLDRRDKAPLGAKLQPIIEHYGARNTTNLQQTIESRYNACDAPVIFVVNKPSRPCALTDSTAFFSSPHEWSYIGQTNDKRFHYLPLAHEILHQFGAEDLYHPPKVYQLAKEIFPDSIMHHGCTVDPLTAYLVGWTADLLPDAEKFMSSVKDVTAKDYLASLKRENEKTIC